MLNELSRTIQTSSPPTGVNSDTAAAPIVQFQAVEKTYDGVVNVVENLNLDILQGEFLTLLGPSGSGKTTTLMMLAGFEEPTAGDIVLKGRSLKSVPPFRRNMGVVFQNYALFPHMTVGENVGYPLEQRRMPRAEVGEKVQAALDMVELGAMAGRRPAQLSGGQQQRVALARALVFAPDVVLMDEPLGALDKRLREQMQVEIKHLHETLGMTFVYVTHDQSEALTMSDRIAVFHQGRIQQIGPAQDVYEAPMNAFVANFIGENNNLAGTVERIDGGDCTVRLDAGPVVRATNVLRLRAGARTTAAIRPERLRIGRDSAGDGAIRLSVGELIYFGDHVRVRLDGERDLTLMAKVAIGSTGFDPRVGEAVHVGWEAAHCRALDPSAPQGAAAG